MKGNLIALGMRLVGLGDLWDRIDGMKTYLGASAEILTGLGGVLVAAATLISNFVAAVHSLGDVINFGQAQMDHPSTPVIALTMAWAAVIHGWGVMAAKHAEDKRHAELLVAAAAPVAVTNVVVAPTSIAAPAQPAAAAEGDQKP